MLEDTWIQIFTITGGLGIAGFAIVTELMASADRRYMDAFHNLKKEMAMPSLNRFTLDLGPIDFDDSKSMRWMAIRLPTGEPVKPQPEANDRVYFASSHLLAVSSDGFAFPTEGQDVDGTTYDWWPSNLSVARKISKKEIKWILPLVEKVINEADAPYSGTFWYGVIFRKARAIFSSWVRYQRLHNWRIGFIVLTGLGWSGALIVASWPVVRQFL